MLKFLIAQYKHNKDYKAIPKIFSQAAKSSLLIQIKRWKYDSAKFDSNTIKEINILKKSDFE